MKKSLPHLQLPLPLCSCPYFPHMGKEEEYKKQYFNNVLNEVGQARQEAVAKIHERNLLK